MFTLTVARGEDQGKTLRLEPGKTYTVGTDAEASLVLTDPKVLPGHCSLEVAADAVLLRNHTASAGTFVGEKKIAQARLGAPSAFRIGDTVLSLRPAPRTAARPAAEPDPLVGKIVGGYKLNEVVGKGGMGTVYRATQLSLQRDVAVKVLAPHLAKDRSFVDLFVHEARAAAQLVHPNVVQVYDAGTEGEVSFFSMEFIGQGSVEEILEREKKLPWDRAILMALEAAHGIEYAEGKGMVHRDIKPDNLMINDDGRVKIADLGLAKQGERRKDQGIIGTPHFIAPEQALGKEVDTRADIYSLGATFFRMCTGQTLFTGKTAKEIVLKHINEPPPAASSVDKEIPDDLDVVLARMLAKDPAQRYQTAEELIRALEEVCAHHGIKGAIIKKGVGKRVLIPVLLLLVAAIGGVVYLVTREPYDPAAVKRAEEAEKERQRAIAEQQRLARENELKEREARKSNANFMWVALDKGQFGDLDREIRLKSIYDVQDGQEEERERRWLNLADQFEVFSKSPAAVEFEDELQISSKALEKARWIRTALERAKKSADSKRQWIKQQVEAAKKIDGEQRDELVRLQTERRFADAHELCTNLSADEPLKDDPFRPVQDSQWNSPIENDQPEPAEDVKAIMDVIKKARSYFGEQKALVPKLAEQAWKTVAAKVPDNLEDAKDAELEAAVGELQGVEDTFGDLGEYRGNARRKREALEKELEKRQAVRLAADRALVKSWLRKLRTLDPEASPNFSMDCEYPQAINEWTKLKEQLATPLYRNFAAERAAMLGWTQYLFQLFQADLRATPGNGGPPPLRSLDLDWSAEETGFKLGKPGAAPYSFTVKPKRQGQEEFHFGKMPMDWIYDRVFHTPQGELRWSKVEPVHHFALGAFCYETMQFEAGRKHFEALADDPRYGPIAKHFASRCQRESAALDEYVKILETERLARGGSLTAQQVVGLQQSLRAFPKLHAGTLFAIEVLEPNTEVETDFHTETEVPAVPPPPKSE